MLAASGILLAVWSAGGSRGLLPSSRTGGLPEWMAGPFAGLAPGPLPDGLFWGLLAGMTIGYAALLAVRGDVGPRVLWAAVVGLHLVFLLAPPLFTTDPFGYLAYARLAGLEDVSPYSTGLEELAEDDPVRDFYGWERGPSPYGPLFTVAAYGLVPFGLVGGFWVVKATTAAASLATLGLLWRLAPRLGRSPRAALAFAGLNPVLLVWAVAGAHNDLFVTTLLLAALAALVRGRTALAGGAAALAAGVKASAGLLLPLLVVGVRARGRALAGAIAGLAAGAAAGLVVLGPRGLAGYPQALASQGAMVSVNSPAHLLGELVGAGGAGPAVRLVAGALLLAGTAALCLRLARTRLAPGSDRRQVTAWGWQTVLTLVTATWLMPWYVALVLPLAALSLDRRLRAATLALCLFVVVTRFPLPPG